MQTFLPFAGFQSCAFWLDDKRLNKQIVEAWQIMTGRVPNANHPVCLMWKGREVELGAYAYECCLEYCRRYKKHGLNDKIRDLAVSLNDGYIVLPCSADFPKVLYISHRVNLLAKTPCFTKTFGSFFPPPTSPPTPPATTGPWNRSAKRRRQTGRRGLHGRQRTAWRCKDGSETAGIIPDNRRD